MSEKIRICWYCEKWQPGGIQAVQVNILQHMDLERFHVDVVVSEDDTTLFDEKLCSLGVNKIVTLDNQYTDPASRVLANIFAFGRLIKENHYDVVHLNVCHGVELLYCFWAWFYRVPVRIVHCRNNDIGAGGRSRKFKIFCHNVCKRLFRNCPTLKLANSDLAAAWLYTRRDLEKGRVTILRNGIDARRYAFDPQHRTRIRHELGLDQKFVVGHVGHFNYQKNHEYLLTIFREIFRINPDAVLLLVGAGDNRDNVELLAQEYGISDHIVFYGVTNDIPAVMMAMDVFVLPSRFEGFGNVLMEAQACGLRCFASDSVIPKSVQITDLVTWIALEEDSRFWAEKICTNGSEYERKSYVDSVIAAGFDVSNMADALERMYETGR